MEYRMRLLAGPLCTAILLSLAAPVPVSAKSAVIQIMRANASLKTNDTIMTKCNHNVM